MMRMTTTRADRKLMNVQKRFVNEMQQLNQFGDFSRLKHETDDFGGGEDARKANTLRAVINRSGMAAMD